MSLVDENLSDNIKLFLFDVPSVSLAIESQFNERLHLYISLVQLYGIFAEEKVMMKGWDERRRHAPLKKVLTS